MFKIYFSDYAQFMVYNEIGRTCYLIGIDNIDVWLVMRLGPVVQDALLRIPPAMMRHWGWLSWMLCSRCRQWVAGAGCRGCFAPDAASYDKILGPVFQDALLRMQYRQWAYRIKRIVTGAGVCGCFAPDTASKCWIRIGGLGLYQFS